MRHLIELCTLRAHASSAAVLFPALNHHLPFHLPKCYLYKPMTSLLKRSAHQFARSPAPCCSPCRVPATWHHRLPVRPRQGQVALNQRGDLSESIRTYHVYHYLNGFIINIHQLLMNHPQLYYRKLRL